MSQRRPTSDILAIYTRDVARHSVMDPEQEKRVGEKALDGDESAQEQLVTANLRFVISIAKRYRHHGVSMNDLIQAGNIGLYHAAKKFDPSVGVRFISYAVYWIVQQIQKEIDANKGTVRPTQTQMVRLRRVRRLQEEARQKLGRELTIKELKKETGYTEARIREALEYRMSVYSLDAPVSPGEDSSTTLSQVIPDEDLRPEREHQNAQQRAISDVLSEVLSEREREIVEEYFGFHDRRELSLTEIGDRRNISRERARQLKERALKKLRAAREHHDLLGELFVTAEAMAERREMRRDESSAGAHALV